MAPVNPVAALRIRNVRAALPAAAFEPNPRRLWQVVAHSAIILACYWWIHRWPATAPLAALVIGNSMACFGFIAHEVSHNAVVRHRALKYALLLWTFGLNFVAPTMWNRLHNDAHHANAGTPGDPDRPFLDHEASRATAWYSTVFYPSASSWKTVFVFCHFISYLLRNMVAVFYPAGRKPSIVTSKPSYRNRERLWTGAEIAWMIALQYGVWRVVGATWWGFVWASLVPLCITSTIVMAYVFTQHFLNPIEHETDPIAGTTSLIVPRWIDWLHCNFSFHTEHHVFPAMNSSYYPLVSTALREEAGNDYARIGARDAWRQLWKTRMFRRISERPS
ncbi:MAG TPA: fatty acid desaturase [Vicinamibacterales bacterium]|nr:fatty acid desaturase [Vicinamibacterales bacterium]